MCKRRSSELHGLIWVRYKRDRIYESEREHGRIRNRLTFSWIKSRYQNRCLKASLWERVNVRGSFAEKGVREEGYAYAME